MSNGYQTLINHFTTNQWNFERDDEAEILRASYAGKNVEFRCAAMINDDEIVQFFSVLPTRVPPEKRALVAELCVRASFGMKVGTFEFDMETGDIRFHTSAPYPVGTLDDSVIRHVIGINLIMTDKYYPAFMSVIFAGQSPVDAIQAIEQTPS